jgi:hypothetical protein
MREKRTHDDDLLDSSPPLKINGLLSVNDGHVGHIDKNAVTHRPGFRSHEDPHRIMLQNSHPSLRLPIE